MKLLVEYKFFEPASTRTDLPDWGTSALMCRRLGPQAQVLVDTGHHPQGTNIEQIVAVLLAEGLLGGFHFNNRKYADDDLIVGAIDPFELFRIAREIVRAPDAAGAIALMIDQSHNVEGKIDAMIQSVGNIQTAYAKALLVDEERLAAAQAEGDVLGAHRILIEAFETDVRPLLARLRERLGVEADPVEAFRRGGYAERLARGARHERGRERVRVGLAVRIALFVTCLGDTIYPEVGRATVEVLERLGHEVVFPAEQTCCGQMHVNSGYRDEAAAARAAVRRRSSTPYEAVVTPSSSCAGCVRDLYPDLLGERPPLLDRVFELSELLVRRLGVEDVGASYPRRVAYHPTCHSLRVTRVGDAPLPAARATCGGSSCARSREAEECCGFGGTFAIKNADTSSAMLADKCARVEESGAEVCTAVDGSCLLQIGGGLSRRRSPRAHRPPRRDPRVAMTRDASRKPRGASSRTRSCGRTSRARPARSAASARASSPSCPTGRSCARPAARSRPT